MLIGTSNLGPMNHKVESAGRDSILWVKNLKLKTFLLFIGFPNTYIKTLKVFWIYFGSTDSWFQSFFRPNSNKLRCFAQSHKQFGPNGYCRKTINNKKVILKLLKTHDVTSVSDYLNQLRSFELINPSRTSQQSWTSWRKRIKARIYIITYCLLHTYYFFLCTPISQPIL